MKTKMSKVFLIACLLGCSVARVQGQPSSWKYPKIEGENTIVSRDAAGGIKVEALLTTNQKTFLMDQSAQPSYDEKSKYNKVSAKFEVASADAHTAATTWEDAYDKCKNYSQESGGGKGSWRLPTQRELMLIWMFKTKLTGCGTLSTVSSHFWSSTAYSGNASNAWRVSFWNGDTTNNDKITPYYVRCVRDL